MAGERAEGTVEIFCAYSHKDAGLLDQFLAHTSILRRTGAAATWTDKEILAGSRPDREIDSHLNSANIIVLLVSADFINSDYCFGKEMVRAMEREAADEAEVVPVIVRPCLWREAPFGKLAELPRGGKAITEWPVQDLAWLDVAIELSKVVKAGLERVERKIEISTQVQTAIDASNQEQMKERWRILQDTQRRISEIQADITTKQDVQDKAYKRWDKYIRDA